MTSERSPRPNLSDHFDGQRFRNPGENARGFSDFLKWIANRRRTAGVAESVGFPQITHLR